MQEFDYIKPRTIQEVLSLLSKGVGNPKVLSGGTDLISQLSDERVKTGLIIDIKGIPEANEVKTDDGNLFIGAGVSCLMLSKNKQLNDIFPGLIEAISLIGGPQIQGRASIGGNICNASPAADSLPSLIVHSAECIVEGPKGKRSVPVENFCIGPGKTILQKGEFLLGINIPVPSKGFGASYQRFIPRNEMDIAVVGVGSSITIDMTKKMIKSARVALGAVGPTPIYARESEKPLIDKSINDPDIHSYVQEASQIARKLAKPITDMRGSKEQRLHLTEVLTRRTLTNAIQRVKKTLEENQ